MGKKDQDEVDSIVSLEDTDSEVETKTKPKKELSNQEKGLTKTGRVKKEMSQKQKENLAKARVAARLKRKELSELRKQEKDIKKDSLLVRKLEVEAKVREHKAKLQQLAIKAGYEPNESEKKNIIKQRKKRVEKDHLEDDDYDKRKKNEIEDLQNQLKALQKKHKVVEPESDNSESEKNSDSEEEEYVKPQKPIKKVVDEKERIKPKKPTFKADPVVPPEESRKKPKDPFNFIKTRDIEDPELQKALNSLFC